MKYVLKLKSKLEIICLVVLLLPCNSGMAAQMLDLGKEMIRINSTKKHIEFSTDKGRNWNMRYTGSSYGTFIDLVFYDNELVAATSKGIYSSTDKGKNWSVRYTGSSCGTFQSLIDGGRELLAQTTKGLYYSTDNGRNWSKRK